MEPIILSPGAARAFAELGATTQQTIGALIERPMPGVLFLLHSESSEERLKALTTLLEWKRTWMQRDKVAMILGWEVRTVRATASRSSGTILSGPKGLCLTRYATTDEANHARAVFISQGKKMLKRAGEIARVQHELIHNREKGVA